MADLAPRLLAAALATTLLVACGSQDGDDGRGTAEESASDAVITGSDSAPTVDASREVVVVADGTRKAAQAALDEAEQDLLSRLTARFALSWSGGGTEMPLVVGAFDLGTPAYHQTYSLPEGSFESRLTEGHAWTQVSGADVAPELDGCWVHFTTGTGRGAEGTAYPPAALMLVEPSALGFREGSDREVVVEVLLQEAAFAMMPKVANQLANDIDPEASVTAVVTLRQGRYASLVFDAADVVGAFGADQLPPMVAASGDALRQSRVRIDYSGFGARVDVPIPDPSEVIELGDRDALLEGGGAADGDLQTCATNR